MSPDQEAVELLLNQGQWHHAHEALHRVLSTEPENIWALTRLVFACLKLGRIEEADALLQQSLSIAPNLAEVHYLMSACRFMGPPRVVRGLFEPNGSVARRHAGEALVWAERAVGLEPLNANYLGWTARVACDAGRHTQAISIAGRGLAVDPTEPLCLEAMTITQQKQRRLASANTINLRALSEAPGSDMPHARRGWLMLQQGELTEAERCFRESLRLDPQNLHHRLGLTEVRLRKRRIYRGSAAVQQVFEKWSGRYADMFRLAIWVWFITALLLYPFLIWLMYDAPGTTAPLAGLLIMCALLSVLVSSPILLLFITTFWLLPGIWGGLHNLLRQVLVVFTKAER
ncbi:MAG: tetratricopeptide repeat protein [Planctomycetota bacterium]